MNIICDIAGQYNALMRLIGEMPKDDEIILVGDLMDRGPESPRVIQWVIDNTEMYKITSLMGNHEHMMIDHYEKTGIYQDGLWEYNGGFETLRAYENSEYDPLEHVKWLKTLSLFVETDKFFISHSCIFPLWDKEHCISKPLNDMNSLIWNRHKPRRKDKYQIFGHNSHWGLKRFSDHEGEYAICIDTTQSRKLTGYNTKSNTIYQVDYGYGGYYGEELR